MAGKSNRAFEPDAFDLNVVRKSSPLVGRRRIWFGG
jgi:hypothetical protein